MSEPVMDTAPLQTSVSILKGAMTPGRLLYLDNLKIFLIIVVILHHAGQPYGSYASDWPVFQGNISQISQLLLGWFFDSNSAYFMGLFFLISAYFVPASFDRKGALKYLKDRLIRLGIPLFLFVLLILPVMGYLVVGLPILSFKFGVGHLWFVAWLLIFGVAYGAWRIVSKPLHLKPLKINVPGNLAILGFTIALTLAYFIVRIWFRAGDWELAHFVEPARLPGYIALFGIGIVAYRNDWFSRIKVKTGLIWGAIAAITILILPVLYVLFGDQLWYGGATVPTLVSSAWDALICVGLCVSLPVIFRERLNFQGRILRSMSENAYTVYLIHVFVLVLIQVLILSLDLHPLLKFVIVAVIGVPLSFYLSGLIRRLPYANRVL
jgi:glucans biosynthesis protein C